MRLKNERPAIGVHHRMTLAAIDLLAGIVTARPAGFGALDALAVDHRRRRARLSPDPLAVGHQQVMVDRLEHTSSRSRMNQR